DAAALGGSLTLEPGAVVEGDVGVLGGELRRDDGARVGGEVREGVRKWRRHHHHREHAGRGARSGVKTSASQPADDDTGARSAGAGSGLGQLARGAIDALHGGALLFVFGAVLLALAPDRMDKLRVQIAAHPMRSFATGVVALLAGVVLAA